MNKLGKLEEKDRNEKKLLFLGAGGSGKSTLFKQMDIIHGNTSDSTEWKRTFKSIVYVNVISGMKGMYECYSELMDQKELEEEMDEKLAEDFEMFAEGTEDEAVVSKELAGRLDAIWQTPCIQSCWQKRSAYQIQDSLAYFMDKERLDRISEEDYLPSTADILHIRSRTTGIVEKRYRINKHPFLIVDVGGQRSERKKWMHCFAEVTAVIFVAALSSYDQVLYEDDSQNRMIESLQLFEKMLALDTFENVDMILFLNKRDLFAEKIVNTKITCAFPEYQGPHDEQNSFQYIKQKFLNCNKKKHRKIYVHKTNATDSNLIRNIFNDVQQTIVQNSLRKAGLIAY